MCFHVFSFLDCFRPLVVQHSFGDDVTTRLGTVCPAYLNVWLTVDLRRCTLKRQCALIDGLGYGFATMPLTLKMSSRNQLALQLIDEEAYTRFVQG